MLKKEFCNFIILLVEFRCLRFSTSPESSPFSYQGDTLAQLKSPLVADYQWSKCFLWNLLVLFYNFSNY